MNTVYHRSFFIIVVLLFAVIIFAQDKALNPFSINSTEEDDDWYTTESDDEFPADDAYWPEDW